MERNEKSMSKFKIVKLKKQFNHNQQGYSLIKCMFLRFVILSIDKNPPSIKTVDGKILKYWESLKEQINNNLEEIRVRLGEEFRALSLDCIVSFSTYNEKGSGFEQVLAIIEELSCDALKDFIIDGIDDSGYSKETCDTPVSLCELVNGLMKLKDNSDVMDIHCASGNFLVNSAKKFKNNIYYGVEENSDARLLTKIRLTLLGCKNKIFALTNKVGTSKFDYIFSQPHFGVKIQQNFDFHEDKHIIQNLKPIHTREWIVIDKILSSLKENGKGIIVVPEGILINSFDTYQRQTLVSNNYIEAIIKLPQNLFQYTSIQTSLMILSKNNSQKNIKFFDASDMYEEEDYNRVLKVDEILNAYENGGFFVSEADLFKNNFVLSINRYKGIQDLKINNPESLSLLVDDIFRGVNLQSATLKRESTKKVITETYKVVMPGDIVDGTFEANSLEKIELAKKYEKYLLQNNDVLISCKSTKVKTSIVEIKEGEKIIPSGSIVVIRCNKEKLNPIYLKLFLDSDIGAKLLASIQTGTAIILINPKDLANVHISNVPMTKQNELAQNYLATLDLLKIERRKVEKIQQKLDHFYDDFIGD